MRKFIRRMDERGQGIVEYALILAFVVIIAAAITPGGISEKVASVSSSVAAAFVE